MTEHEQHHDLSSLDIRINDRGFFERILKEREKFEYERDRRLDERFRAQEIASDLVAKELSRRLENLNHAYEQAQKKEYDFLLKSTYEIAQQRNEDEHDGIRDDIVASAKVLSTAQNELQKANDARISRLENFQSKLLGLALAAPIITALIFYLLTNRVG